MRRLVTTEIGLVLAFAGGLLVSYIGLAVFISGKNRFVGALVLVLGLWMMISAPVVHNRAHRERGEAGHALWGPDERWKPPWWRPR